MQMSFGKARVWEETVTIPTYGVGAPNKNPMFLEKRVYQGSSGRVYPHPVTDKIFDEKADKAYRAIFLENDFIRVMLLPEIGGRIQRAYDKIGGQDFVYYNHVIKPALVGLAGPWISGGIEFNWPQHHRPSTFDPVDYTCFENADGSATAVMGEIETMFRTKSTVRFTLYPDRAYIEISAQLYNRTPLPQTFLWWANPAARALDNSHAGLTLYTDLFAKGDFVYATIESGFAMGERREGTSTAVVNDGFFDSFKANGGTHMFAGHDHNNNFITEYEGVTLGYMTKSSYNCYFDFDALGGTVLTLDADNNVTAEIVPF